MQERYVILPHVETWRSMHAVVFLFMINAAILLSLLLVVLSTHKCHKALQCTFKINKFWIISQSKHA